MTNQKIVYILVAVAIVSSFFLGTCYQKKMTLKHTGIDTAVKEKTHFVVINIPIPYQVVKDSVIFVRRTTHDTLEKDSDPNIVYVPENTPQWLVDAGNDYMSTRLYDSTIADGGDTLILRHEINRNRIKRSEYNWKHNDTIISKTTILKPPRDFVAYLTFSALASQNHAGFFPGFGIKTPKEKYYQLEAGRITGIKENIYKLTVGFPILKSK